MKMQILKRTFMFNSLKYSIQFEVIFLESLLSANFCIMNKQYNKITIIVVYQYGSLFQLSSMKAYEGHSEILEVTVRYR